MARAKKVIVTKKGSKVVRFSEKNYDEFVALKDLFAKRHDLKKVTFDTFIEELFSVARLLINGREVYELNGKLYADIAEARGAALQAATKNKKVRMPQILLVMGEDTFLRNAHE